MFGALIRGGQVTVHGWRMGLQLFKIMLTSFLIIVLLAVVFQGWRFYEGKPRVAQAALYYYMATTLTFKDDHAEIGYTDQFGRPSTLQFGQIRRSPAFAASARLTERAMIQGVITGSMIGGSMALIMVVGFWARGRGVMTSKRIKGAHLVTPRQLKKLIPWKARGKYNIAGIPWREDDETLHTLIVGSTGTGKTIAISNLLDQIEANGDKAIVYDKLGSFIPHFYKPERDIILNPFDKRGAEWCLFREAQTETDFHNMAAALIPDFKDQADPFWQKTARLLFACGASAFWKENNYNLQELLYLLTSADMKELAAKMEGTEMQSIISTDQPKTALSVRSMLTSNIHALGFLPPVKEPFSIREWVQNTDQSGFLFLSSHAATHEVRRAMIATQIEMAIVAKLSMSKGSPQRLWLIIDELPTLAQIPSLSSGLRESRQFGMSIVLGTQVFSELKDLYGHQAAITLSGNCNTRLCLATPDRDTANWMSDGLGRVQIEKITEGLSYGASEIRDGVTQNRREELQPLVLPSDLMSLEKLQGFLKLPRELPVAQIRLKPKNRKEIAEAFIPIDERTDPLTGEVYDNKSLQPSGPPTIPEEKLPDDHRKKQNLEWPWESKYGPVTVPDYINEGPPPEAYENDPHAAKAKSRKDERQAEISFSDNDANLPKGQSQSIKTAPHAAAIKAQEPLPKLNRKKENVKSAKPKKSPNHNLGDFQDDF